MNEMDLALLLLRVVAGCTMAYHGLNKTKNLGGTGKWFESMGMRPGPVQARLASATEIVAGAALALGLLTPFAGAAFVGLMTVAAIVSHRKNGFFIFNKGEGWEYTMVLATIGLTLAMIGPGRYSLDHAIGFHLHEWIGLLVGLGGVVAAVALLALSWRPSNT
jgi:putative oxidoreductase